MVRSRPPAGDLVPELPWGTLLAGGGPPALLALVVLSVIRGWLVPASTVTLLLAQVDTWKAVAATQEKTIATQAEQLSVMTEYMRSADVVFRQLPGAREPAA